MAIVVADPHTRIIDVTTPPDGNGVVELNVVDDVYEKLKDDWHSDATLKKLRFPFRSFGDSQGTAQIGPYVFVENRFGWRLRSYDADHELRVTGNLVPESAVAGEVVPLWLARPGRTIVIREAQSAQTLTTTSGAGEADWTGTERAQIRHRLGIDGASSEPSATPSLASAVWDHTVEGVYAARSFMRRIASALFGKTTGVGTLTENFRSMADDKNRVTMTYDAQGNRITPSFDDS